MNRWVLLRRLAARDIAGRYRGSLLGIAWSFVNPAMMLAVYAFVFGVVLPVRWPSARGGLDFACHLFAGLVAFNFFAECVNRAPGLILAQASYVKKVVFPLELLPAGAVLAALAHAAIGLAVLGLLAAASRGGIPPSALWIPAVWLPFALGMLGLSWMLSALGVYWRDIGQITGPVATAMMFLAPVLYPVTSLPETARDWVWLNPLTVPVVQTRRVLLQGLAPDWVPVAGYAVACAILAWLGLVFFARARRGFADVL